MICYKIITEITGDVKASIYCDHYVRLTLFCIFLAWIETSFVVGPVVSIAIHVARLDWVGPMIEMGVGVGGRVYQVHPKDVLWG